MKRRFTAKELYEVRNLIPIDVLIKDLLAIPFRTSEGRFRFLCPICKEFQTATSNLSNLARCFRCERQFNTIEMVMEVTSDGFVESVKYLQSVRHDAGQVKSLLSGIGKTIA